MTNDEKSVRITELAQKFCDVFHDEAVDVDAEGFGHIIDGVALGLLFFAGEHAVPGTRDQMMDGVARQFTAAFEFVSTKIANGELPK